jgi:hypothetical protein
MLEAFVKEVKKNGFETVSTAQLRQGLLKYFGVRKQLISDYMKDLHALGFIEQLEKGWRLK